MDKDTKIPDEFVYMTSEPETKNNELVAMTDNEAANNFLKNSKINILLVFLKVINI